MSVTKSKTAEHDADIKDNSHKRAKLEAFAEAQARNLNAEAFKPQSGFAATG